MFAFGFSDEELDLLRTLASPLPPPERAGFLRLVSSMVAAHPPQARGPGLLHRLGVEAQKDILKGGSVAVGAGKFGRRGRYG